MSTATPPVSSKLFGLFCLASYLLSLSCGSTFLLSLLIGWARSCCGSRPFVADQAPIQNGGGPTSGKDS
ncbi:hypothetical protein DM828_18520 [Pseudomonas umsongensis]|nr:hypothetical protein [Pseudomonas umsongensis]